MCMIDNGNVCEFWSEAEVTARKPHVCCCCSRTIAKGEKYVRHFSVFEGDCERQKVCGQCFQDRETFAAAHGGYKVQPSFLRSSLQECIGEDDESDQWRPMLARIDARGEAKPC